MPPKRRRPATTSSPAAAAADRDRASCSSSATPALCPPPAGRLALSKCGDEAALDVPASPSSDTSACAVAVAGAAPLGPRGIGGCAACSGNATSLENVRVSDLWAALAKSQTLCVFLLAYTLSYAMRLLITQVRSLAPDDLSAASRDAARVTW